MAHYDFTHPFSFFYLVNLFLYTIFREAARELSLFF